MLVARPVRADDLEALMRLGAAAGVGLTTMPREPDRHEHRINASLHAFRPGISRPAGEIYFLVLEDLLTGEVWGCSGVLARVGGYEPFYSYELRTTVKEAEALGVRNEIQSLHLVANHKGPSEIGTLFLHPDQRGQGAGRLISLARFALMAAFPERFAETVIAEMRGVVDAQGRSPFWEALGRHFFEMDFGRADVMSAADKQFIADLMPQHPIYVPMLPKSAQAVVGAVHVETRPAMRLLEQEGFVFGGEVDIFDAGPMVRAKRNQIRSVAESQVAPLGAVTHGGDDGGPYLLSNDRLEFRACLGALQQREDGTVAVPRDVALALELRLGDPVRWVAARAPCAPG